MSKSNPQNRDPYYYLFFSSVQQMEHYKALGYPAELASMSVNETENVNEKGSETITCRVCGNSPDSEGWLTHGKGCYTQSEDGGGDEYFEEADEHKRNDRSD